MNSDIIKKEIEATVISRGCFIVDIAVSRDNDSEITIESDNGTVDMEDCIAVNNAFLNIFDRDKEDYSLTVTSAGLDQPFKVLRQFQKAIGSLVEVRLKGGRKLIGKLMEAQKDCIRIEYEQNEIVDGKKKKIKVMHDDIFNIGEINTVMPHIDF